MILGAFLLWEAFRALLQKCEAPKGALAACGTLAVENNWKKMLLTAKKRFMSDWAFTPLSGCCQALCCSQGGVIITMAITIDRRCFYIDDVSSQYRLTLLRSGYHQYRLKREFWHF